VVPLRKYYYTDLLRIGVPIMLGQLSTIVMGFADTLMVGRYGTSELAAAGFVNNVLGLLLIGGMGFSYGITPVVGSLLGEGRVHDIAAGLKNGLFACLGVGMLLMSLAGLLYVFLPGMGQPVELLPLMRPYLLVLMLSLLPQMVFNAYKQFSDGVQDTAMPMWIMLLSNVLNILGNWLLIFGHLGFPEMGLFGAGISTLVSRVVQLVLMAGVFHLTKRYEPYRQDFPEASITTKDQKELHRLGWPVALQLGMEAASFSFSAIYVGWLGATALAAHQVMIVIGQLFFMLYYGMSAAVAVQVSYYRGAGEGEQMLDDSLCALRALDADAGRGRAALYAEHRRGLPGGVADGSFPVLSGGRCFAMHLCQCPSWHGSRQADDLDSIRGLHCHIPSLGLPVWLRLWVETCGRVDGIPIRPDHSWPAVL